MKNKTFIFLACLLMLSINAQAQTNISIDSISAGPSDGRFTLGAENQKLLYGYPIPYSTSHFVIAVEDTVNGDKVTKYASNNPSLSAIASYLSGKTEVKVKGEAPTLITTFLFRQVKVVQKLTPTNKDFNVITDGSLAQYYMVSYEIDNLSNQEKQIGLIILFDTMIDDNDACVIDADNQRIIKETSFAKNIPTEFLLYRRAGDKNDMLGICITNVPSLKIEKPTELIAGRWPYLHGVLWEVKAQDVGYTDSALLLKWNKQKVSVKGKMQFSTLYGLPKWKEPKLKLITQSNKIKQESAVVYFPLGSSTLDYNGKLIINNLCRNKDVKGVILDGYSDALGGNEAAIWISKQRIQTVKQYIKDEYQVTGTIEKVHGLESTDLSMKNTGNPWDRKVSITILYEPKD